MSTDHSRELDAVDMARDAKCPYCSKTVSMSARTLGDHRAVSGMCDGSRRAVSSFSRGVAVFASPQQDQVRPGSSTVQHLLTGKTYTVADWRNAEGSATLRGSDGSTESVSGSDLAYNYRIVSYEQASSTFASVGDRYRFDGDGANEADDAIVISDEGSGYVKVRYSKSGRESIVPSQLLDGTPRWHKA
ncbi:MAG: hypothetical protein ABI445_21875 [Polyangia bacterium]